MIKVLIVDDEYIMRQGLKYMINWEQEGYEIVGEATNGAEALERIRELEPDIILCDIVMPQLDGVDFSEAVHNMFPKVQTIILSGYDNFEYVRHTLMNGAVDYILKPTLNPEELLRVLKKAAERIPGYKACEGAGAVNYERMLERYLLGHDRELDVKTFSTYFTASYYRIFSVNVNKQNDNGQDMGEVLTQKIKRGIQDIPSAQKLLVTIREGLICVIFCYEWSQDKGVIAGLQTLTGQMAILCPYVLGIVSRRFDSLEQLHEVYQQDILKNVDKSFYYPDTKFLVLEKQQKEAELPTVGKLDFFRYNQLLNNKQYGDAARVLGEYNRSAVEGQMDVYRLKNQMKNMIYHFLDLLQLPDEEREDYRYTYFQKINHAMYADAYLECIDRVLEELQNLSGQNGLQMDERMDKMLAYIDKNYPEDLKLEDLASEFNFNYHYLSVYFSQQMKEGFSDYLNRIRINKACQLLRESTLPISEISSKVGYTEHSYFCRVFKKVTGETPSVWRRNG